MKSLKFIDYVLVVEALILAAMIGFIAIQNSHHKCTLTFEVQQGVNYNQPYPTYRYCGAGDVPEVK